MLLTVCRSLRMSHRPDHTRISGAQHIACTGTHPESYFLAILKPRVITQVAFRYSPAGLKIVDNVHGTRINARKVIRKYVAITPASSYS